MTKRESGSNIFTIVLLTNDRDVCNVQDLDSEYNSPFPSFPHHPLPCLALPFPSIESLKRRLASEGSFKPANCMYLVAVDLNVYWMIILSFKIEFLYILV